MKQNRKKGWMYVWNRIERKGVKEVVLDLKKTRMFEFLKAGGN
jgi:hypothetical protein